MQYEGMAEKLTRAIDRLKALREMRDAAERDIRTIRLEGFREMRRRQRIMRHIIRELTHRRKVFTHIEKRLVSKMALERSNWYTRRHIWKKIRRVQEDKSLITKKIR